MDERASNSVKCLLCTCKGQVERSKTHKKSGLFNENVEEHLIYYVRNFHRRPEFCLEQFITRFYSICFNFDQDIYCENKAIGI